MDEEAYQATLNSVIERISQLENEVRELRQLIFVQKPPLAKPIDTPSSIAANSDSSGLVVAETDYWEVTCLGNFCLRCAGHELALCKSRRGQSILKYLLASPGYAASSEVLIERFWPQVDPEAGVHSLQVAIHTLRRSLRGCGPDGGDETVLFHNSCYIINPSISIVQDVDRFRVAYERGQHYAKGGRLDKAVKAFEEARHFYTGDYLADCYEEWAASRRLDLIDIRLALLSQLGSLYSQEKEWEGAISCYRDILVIDCYREDIYRLLMGCYAACGRKADIKRTYHACQERLRCDLHLAPAPETIILYQQLTQQ